jgi:hypothetical protein
MCIRCLLSLPTTHYPPITFPPPFIFIFLQTPSPATLFVSHPYKTPGVWGGYFCLAVSRITGHESQVTPVHGLAASLAPPKKSTPLQSSKSRLFFGNAGVWGWASRSRLWTLGGSRRRLPVPETQLRDTRGGGYPPAVLSRHSSPATSPWSLFCENTGGWGVWGGRLVEPYAGQLRLLMLPRRRGPGGGRSDTRILAGAPGAARETSDPGKSRASSSHSRGSRTR